MWRYGQIRSILGQEFQKILSSQTRLGRYNEDVIVFYLVVVRFGFTDSFRIKESKPKSKSDKYIQSIFQPNLNTEGNTESKVKSESESGKYVNSIIQPNPRVIMNPTPNPNPTNMSNP